MVLARNLVVALAMGSPVPSPNQQTLFLKVRSLSAGIGGTVTLSASAAWKNAGFGPPGSTDIQTVSETKDSAR